MFAFQPLFPFLSSLVISRGPAMQTLLIKVQKSRLQAVDCTTARVYMSTRLQRFLPLSKGKKRRRNSYFRLFNASLSSKGPILITKSRIAGCLPCDALLGPLSRHSIFFFFSFFVFPMKSSLCTFRFRLVCLHLEQTVKGRPSRSEFHPWEVGEEREKEASPPNPLVPSPMRVSIALHRRHHAPSRTSLCLQEAGREGRAEARAARH